jgi:hypothetical protein
VSFDERIHQPGGVSERDKREERRGVYRGYIGRVALEWGLGFCAGT